MAINSFMPVTKCSNSSNRSHDPSELAPDALEDAVNYAWDNVHDDGHWYGELKSNATITAEYVMLYQALGLEQSLSRDREALCQWFVSDQNPNGSWSIAPDHPGDVSTTTEAYLALKILGVSTKTPEMQRACSFVKSVGGVAKVRIFTRIYLATFGLFPWKAVPELTAELILMPSWAPINIYNFSSWARSTVVPLLILSHHQPIYMLPNGISSNNDFLDELWCSPVDKVLPYTKPIADLLKADRVALLFTIIDKFIYQLGGLRSFPLRTYSRSQCVKWILKHQEATGDWAGIFPPMHVGILALTLEGFSVTDSCITRGLEAVERFAWQDHEGGKRIQACVSPVWDTVLMSIGLCDAGLPNNDGRLIKAVNWIKNRQLLGPEGDWRIYQPTIAPGGFSFEYHNTWYPDVDDTAAVIIAFLKQDPKSAPSTHLIKAVEWTLGMQNKDGGWAAFDYENNKLFLNKIPFSDMNALLDPSTADVTGRVLEAFGLLVKVSNTVKVPEEFLKKINLACHLGISYLASTQERNGSWYGRWGSNYIYGTSNAVCGLAYHSARDPSVPPLIASAIKWLKLVQHSDGGFGEVLDTYKDATLAGHGKSSASQTAWGAMALLAHLPSSDEAVRRSIAYLVSSQTEKSVGGATWPETEYTGTGFPNFFHLGYEYYPHYFPMMALGRYLRKVERERRIVQES
ncbi:hypothetical protein IMSHALPRED_005856 [Imshaugia aleurites]|uniref:Terpene cyclase/mutase family member n=1 Tax=Imshaugia aleurites TaxID=172621 RepID=A0A8H3FER6_9LECA|nr:hypothetical protein IMSHALPRED_005856 [Imshaugia aleurites]